MNKVKILFFILVMLTSYGFADEKFETPQIASSSFYPYLSVKDIHSEGLVVVLNDGSEWNIKYFSGMWKLLGWGWSEQKNVSHWTMGDIIEIQYPGSGNFTDFLLVIVNLSRKEKALAILKQAPFVDHPACLWVADFDKDTNRITLSDGTIWFKTPIDMYGAFFSGKLSMTIWELGDVLTLIRGEGWLNSNSFLLWNHSINQMPCVNRLE